MTERRSRSVVVFNHVDRLAPRVKQEVHTLCETENEVTVFYWSRGSSAPEDDSNLWTDKHLRTNASVGCIGAVLYLPWLYFRLIKILYGSKFEIVHFTHLVFLPLAPLVRLLGFAVVYDSYEFHALDFSLRFPDSFRPWVESGLKRAEDTLIRAVDCVLTIDSTNAHLARRYERVCSNVTVLYNVPKVSNRDGWSPAEPIQENVECKTYQLVYVGGISVEKGAVQAIKALQALRADGYQVRLQFVGTVQDGNEWFEKSINNAGMENFVQHTTWVPYEKMQRNLTSADVALALHQPMERFRRVSLGNGRKFFTYMEAGLPIVGPTYGEIARVVTQTNCGYLADTTDTNSVVAAISKLLDTPECRIEMGLQGQRNIESRFNWDEEVTKLISAYQQIDTNNERQPRTENTA